MSKLTIVGVIIGVIIMVAYASFVLLGAWIDGRRQAVRERGQRPVTTSAGNVEAREERSQTVRDE